MIPLDPCVRTEMLLLLADDMVATASLADLRAYVKELAYQNLQDLEDREILAQLRARGYNPEDFN